MTDQEKFDALMAPILAKFKTRVKRNLSSYQAFQKHLGKDVLTRDTYEQVQIGAHKIAGSAKTMGFEDLGVSAFEVEKCIKDMLELDGPQLDDRDLIPVFERFLANFTEVSASSADDDVEEVSPPISSSQGDAKWHVLVIDDDDFVGDLVKLALRNDSCKVSEAATGFSGLTFLKSETPDLIVLDVHLPDISGFDVLKEIQARIEGEAIPVVMLTRDEDADSLVSGIAGGALEYLRKPMSVVKLREVLMTTLKFGKKPEPPDSPYHRPKDGVSVAMKRFGFDK